jgi:hypothetical protein
MVQTLRFDEILRVLSRHHVEFIVVGGIAAILQGSPLTTEDLDVVYLSSDGNRSRLLAALAELEARYLDPAGRHIEPDALKLASMRIHLLETRCGRLDVLRTVGAELGYDDLLGNTMQLEVAEFQIRVLDLARIIESKEHANRPKDRAQLPFLRQLLAESRRPGTA